MPGRETLLLARTVKLCPVDICLYNSNLRGCWYENPVPECEMPDVGLLSGAEGTDTELLRRFSGETLPENKSMSDRKRCCVSGFFLCLCWMPKWVEGFVCSRLSCTSELRGAGPEAELWTAPAWAAG